jgi:glycerol transport system ATP-binding protein
MSLRLEAVGRTVAGVRHLSDISLELRPGTLNVLLGPTLSGKTSLLRLMAGLDRPSQGRLFEDGRDVTGVAPERRAVAMVYQQFINYPSLTVFENIASPLRVRRLPAAEVERRVHEVARFVHIEELLGRLPAQLSGGQQQRCAIARALAKEARLLLLDEPLVNLDYKLREELRAELQALFARGQAIVVYATTEPMEALLLGGQLVVLDEGRVLQHGPALDLYHRPASTRVAEILSDPPINLIDGHVADGRIVLGGAVEIPPAPHLTGLASGAYRFGIRAGHLAVGPQRGGEVAIPAEVELAEISGSETFLHLRHGGVSWVVQSEGVHSYGLGEAVAMRLDPRYLFAFELAGRLCAAPDRALEP